MRRPIRDLTDWTLRDELSREDSIAAVLFYRREGHRGRRLERALASLADEYRKLVDCFRLDLNENPSVAESASIKAAPTVVLYIGGEEAERCVRPRGRKEIRKVLEATFKNS